MMKTDDLCKEIGKRLSRIRKDKKLTQEEVISSIGELNLSLRSLKSYEKGKTMIELPKLIVLADYYNVSLDYLIYGRKTINLDDGTWSASLTMLGRLASRFVLMPYKSEKDEFYPGKWKFVAFDPETNAYMDKCFASLDMQRIMDEESDFLREKVHILFENEVKDFGCIETNINFSSERAERFRQLTNIDNPAEK